MAERTARRPRRPASDEADDTPRSSRRGRGREDAEEYEKPEEGETRSSRRGSATRPSRRAAPKSRDEEPPDADDDDGDDDEPSGRRRGSDVKGGWGTWRQRKAESSDFADDFKVEYKEKYLVLFLDAEPFAAFTEHWVDEVPTGTKKSWVCIGKGCPLCEALGEKPKAKAMFNVVEFIEDDKDSREGVHKVWTVGSGVANTLEEIADDIGLEGNYFKVWKTKKGSGRGGSTDYHVEHVKERDLEDDWDYPGLTDEEYTEFEKGRFDGSYVKMPSKSKLKEIAEIVLDNE